MEAAFVVFVCVASAILIGLLLLGVRRPRLVACVVAVGAFLLGLGGLLSGEQGLERCLRETDYGGLGSKPSLIPPGTICEAEPSPGHPIERSTLLPLPIVAYPLLGVFSALCGLVAFGFLSVVRSGWLERRRRASGAGPS